jgi:small subunit ribosomal protein S17
MAEEDKQEQEIPEPAAEHPAADAEEAPAAGEAPTDEPEAEEQAGDEPEAEAEPAAEAPEPEAEEAPLTSKERRRRERSRASGPSRPPRSAGERATERAQQRRERAASRRRNRASRRSKRGEPRPGTPPPDRRPGVRKVRQGTVVSSKPDKTITVQIEIARRHPTYEKVVRRSATLHAHDERNEANEGDIVRVVESRPLSRTKRWRLVEVLERAR